VPRFTVLEAIVRDLRELLRLAEGRQPQGSAASFDLLPRRWVVERSFGWVTRFRRVARDYECLPDTLKGLHFLAFAILMAHRFILCMAFCL
jgi:hypothetical protein